MIDLMMDYTDEKFVLEIKNLNFIEYSDFYYYILDDGLEEKENILLENQIENLKSWEEGILNFSTGEVFLPFDFSDQYLGCFKYFVKDREPLMSYGYFDNVRAPYPSYCRPFYRKDYMGNFIETFPPFKVDRKELIQDIERIISEFYKELNSI